MNNLFRKFSAIAAASTAAMCLTTVNTLRTQAATISFSLSNFSPGGVLSGSFTGEDVNNDSILMVDELSLFDVIWSGNDSVGAFSLGLSNLFSFQFDLNEPTKPSSLTFVAGKGNPQYLDPKVQLSNSLATVQYYGRVSRAEIKDNNYGIKIDSIPTNPIPTEPVPTNPIPTEPVPTNPIPTNPTVPTSVPEPGMGAAVAIAVGLAGLWKTQKRKVTRSSIDTSQAS